MDASSLSALPGAKSGFDDDRFYTGPLTGSLPTEEVDYYFGFSDTEHLSTSQCLVQHLL